MLIFKVNSTMEFTSKNFFILVLILKVNSNCLNLL